MKRQLNQKTWIALCFISFIAMRMQVVASGLPGYDFHYAVRGDRAVAPIQVFDDGQHVYLQFKNQADIPAVFIPAATGMTRMNIHPQFPYFVMDCLSPEVVLKFDGKQAVVTYTGGRALVDGGQSHGAAQAALQNVSASIPQDHFPQMNADATEHTSHFSGEFIFGQNVGGASAVTAPNCLPAPVIPAVLSAAIRQHVSQAHIGPNHRSAVNDHAGTSQVELDKESQ